MLQMLHGSVVAANEATAACLRAAGLNPHACELTAHPFLDEHGRARTLYYVFWVTGFDQELDPQVFPFEPEVGPAGPLPEGAAEVGVDVLTIRHGEAWDTCIVQIRSAMHTPESPDDPAKRWDFRYYRAVQHPEPQGCNWDEATATALAEVEQDQTHTTA